ncbi:hypothetical protein F8M41_018339 [Gigaspora margarita]|uniref:Uncharacterized protein n=1 Tax=Gigaspora margarita TaxID=4874 RepID=A0A8H4ALU9_GIGMA|nr:hypothetical protein F8M41_018339 [Gigaspora margarita]
MRMEDIDEYDQVVFNNTSLVRTIAIAVLKVVAAFSRIETENCTRWIDENYIYKHVTIEITTKKIKMTNNKPKVVAIAKFRHNNYIWNMEILAWLILTHTMITLILLLLIVVNLKARVDIISNHKPLLSLIDDSIKQYTRERQNINNRKYASIAECIKWLQAEHNLQMKYTEDIKIYRELEINLTAKIDPQYILQNQLVRRTILNSLTKEGFEQSIAQASSYYGMPH